MVRKLKKKDVLFEIFLIYTSTENTKVSVDAEKVNVHIFLQSTKFIVIVYSYTLDGCTVGVSTNTIHTAI